jgi:hypothetical protein
VLISVTLISIAIAFIEGIPLIKKRLWKELATLIILLLIAMLLVIGELLSLPTPLKIINNLIHPFGKTFF